MLLTKHTLRSSFEMITPPVYTCAFGGCLAHRRRLELATAGSPNARARPQAHLYPGLQAAGVKRHRHHLRNVLVTLQLGAEAPPCGALLTGGSAARPRAPARTSGASDEAACRGHPGAHWSCRSRNFCGQSHQRRRGCSDHWRAHRRRHAHHSRGRVDEEAFAAAMALRSGDGGKGCTHRRRRGDCRRGDWRGPAGGDGMPGLADLAVLGVAHGGG
mmetsp:Transcript_20433/g.42345  ORF Transcript_20433/g.42345 Transcript_20433/m.42345 type:complete len:216 (+) Transcript_20433:326-973(+)